jgi:Concanavalin A-like lectin/glucanases superfamily
MATRNTRFGVCAGLLASIIAGAASACGSKGDLVIGRDSVAVTPDAGGSAGLAAEVGGSSGSSGVGGAVAGTGGAVGGDSASAGDANAGFAGALDCDPTDVAPVAALLHRYSFSGTGFVATDSAGGAPGDLVDGLPSIPANNDCNTHLKPGRGATLDGNGLLVLDGCRGYVNLPNGLISHLTEVTIAVWATETPGGASFARYFDFGVGTGEDDTSTLQGQTFLTIAASANVPTQLQLLARAAPNVNADSIITTVSVSDNREHQVVAVFVSNSYMELYRDGVRLSTRAPISWPLSNIKDVNDWLGRSQWPNDHTFGGTFNEVRIYGQALDECAIRAMYTAGPDSP